MCCMSTGMSMTIVAVEVFDPKKLDYIIKHEKEYGISGMETYEWHPLHVMKTVLDRSKDGKFTATHVQKYPNMGRHFPKDSLGLLRFPRKVRNTVVDGLVYDFDIENCVGRLSIICAENLGLPCQFLHYYNDNRTECLEGLQEKYLKGRDEVKGAVTKIFFGGRLDLPFPPKWLSSLERELKTLHERLYEDDFFKECRERGEDMAKEKRAKGRFYNPLGSTVALIFQSMENRCFQAMVGYARQAGYIKEDNVFIPEYDGIKLLRANVPDPEACARGMEQAILEHCGYRVTVKNKPMTDKLELPNDWNKKKKKAKTPPPTGVFLTYDDLKEEFERSHFKIVRPVSYALADSSGELYIMCRDKLKALYENKYFVDKDGEVVPFIGRWLGDPQMRTYSRVDFLPPPHACPNDVYNLFTGLRAEGLPPVTNDEVADGLALILDHVRRLGGGGDREYDYIMKWLAHRVQLSGDIPRVAPLFQSDQGSGKSLFFQYFGTKVLGDKYYFTTENIAHLIGKFANGLLNKLLVVLEEANGKDCFSNSESMKNMITEPVFNYEQKGVDTVKVRKCAGFVLPTNNLVVVKLEPSDRRYVIFSVLNDRCNDQTYFKPLLQAMGDDRVTRAFYDHLMSIDLSTFDIVNERPLNTLYRSVQEVSTPAEARFLRDLVRTFKDDEEQRLMTTEDCYKQYNEWYKDNIKKAQEKSKDSFTILFKKFLAPEGTDKNLFSFRTSKHRGVKINKHLVREAFKRKKMFQHDDDVPITSFSEEVELAMDS